MRSKYDQSTLIRITVGEFYFFVSIPTWMNDRFTLRYRPTFSLPFFYLASGIFAEAQERSLFIDSSTIEPAVAKELAVRSSSDRLVDGFWKCL